MKTLMALPTRRSDSDCPEHSLVVNVVMNARAKMPNHLESLIIFSHAAMRERIDAV